MVNFKKHLGWNKTKSIHYHHHEDENHRSAILGGSQDMECLLHETRQAFFSFERIQDNVVYLRYKGQWMTKRYRQIQIRTGTHIITMIKKFTARHPCFCEDSNDM